MLASGNNRAGIGQLGPRNQQALTTSIAALQGGSFFAVTILSPDAFRSQLERFFPPSP